MTAIPSQALSELDTLERKHAANPEGRYFVPLANAYRKVGDIGRAISVLRKGLARHPDYLSAHIVLGRCLADQGQMDAAFGEFLSVLSLDSQNLVALRTLAELAAGKGDLAAARQWYNDLLEVDPMNEEARAALESIAGPRSAAVGSAVARETSAAEARLPLVSRNLVEGDDAGRSELEERETVVTETIAELYTRQGFYSRAAEVYRELIRRRGGDARLQERLERVIRLAAGEHADDSLPSTVLQGATPETALPARPATEPVIEPTARPAGTDTKPITAPTGLAPEPLAGPATEPRDEVFERPVEDAFADSFADGFPSAAAGMESPGIEEPEPWAGPTWERGPGILDDAAPAPDASEARPLDDAEPWAGPTRDRELERTGIAPPAGSTTIHAYLHHVLAWTPARDTEPASDLHPATVDRDAEVSPTFYADEALESVLEKAPGPDSAAAAEPEADSEFAVAGGEAPADRDESRPGSAAAGEETAMGVAGGSEIKPLERTELFEAEPVAEPPTSAKADSTPDDDDLFPWEIPVKEEAAEAARSAEPPPPPHREAPESSPPRFSYEEFEPAPEPVAPTPDEPVESTSSGVNSVPSRSESQSSSGEEDDDLESFQAWLRSLKR